MCILHLHSQRSYKVLFQFDTKTVEGALVLTFSFSFLGDISLSSGAVQITTAEQYSLSTIPSARNLTEPRFFSYIFWAF